MSKSEPKVEKSPKAGAGTGDIDEARVRKLASLLEETGLGEIEYATDQWRIRVVRAGQTGAAPAAATTVAPAPVPVEASAAAEPGPDASHPGAVTSPMVGTVYLTPGPNQPPFVKVGDEVKTGQTLLIIEAMKVMNQVAAPRGGRVAKIYVENGVPVEFGAVLMIVE